MFKYISFNDEINIFWRKDIDKTTNNKYIIYKNGIFCGETVRSYFYFKNLIPDTKYRIKVVEVDYFGKQIAVIGERVLITKRQKNRIDVTKYPYNAVGDGKTLNTVFLQKALDDCTGNDYVYIPHGIFRTGALNVHADTEIYIEKGGILQGTAEPKDYLPKIKSRFEGIERECYRSLINIGTLNRDKITCKDILIRGDGKISGGGKELADKTIEVERKIADKDFIFSGDYANDTENLYTTFGRVRGRLINISSCKDIILQGVEFCESPSWTIHSIYSENIAVYGCKITSDTLNGDGFDPDSSKNVTIFDCDFETIDDCIAIKSGKNPEGNIINKPSLNIDIFDIRVKQGNGISVGSEVSGGVNKIRIRDCDLTFSRLGINIKSSEKRGGYIKNVTVSDCILPSITINAAVTYNSDGESAKHFTKLQNFKFENITITSKSYNYFDYFRMQKKYEISDISPLNINGSGKGKPFIKNVRLINCLINNDNYLPVICENVRRLKLKNTNIHLKRS